MSLIKRLSTDVVLPFLTSDIVLSYISSRDPILQTTFVQELAEPSNLISAGVLTVLYTVVLDLYKQEQKRK